MEIIGTSDGSSTKKRRRKTAKKTAKKAAKKIAKKQTQSKGKNPRPLGQMISDWIDEGFFNDGKTTTDVKNRFAKETIIVPASSIPAYVNKAVRPDNRLTRDKEDVNGKQVWVYRTKK